VAILNVCARLNSPTPLDRPHRRSAADGRLDYRSLLRRLSDELGSARQTTQSSMSTTAVTDDVAKRVQMLFRRAVESGDVASYQAIFDAVDRDPPVQSMHTSFRKLASGSGWI
jgi:hypothetical protein